MNKTKEKDKNGDNNNGIKDDKVIKRTFSIFLKKHYELNNIFKFMGNISKNIYNITIYIYNIYRKYKEDIFTDIIKLINDKIIDDEESLYAEIQLQIKYFYDLYSNNNSNIKINNDIIFSAIKEKLNGNYLTHLNFNEIKEYLLKIKLISNNKYEREFIINSILRSFYLKNYNRTLYEIKNKKPTNIQDVYFIDHVKNNGCLFPKKDSIKEQLKNCNFLTEDLQSDQNIVTRFIYRNLGNNYEKLPSDVICNIIKKVFDNFSSYFKLKDKGLKANMCKYLKNGDLFLLPFFVHSFKIITDVNKNNLVRLTVGKYVANNYIGITGDNNLVCLNLNESTEYKKYINPDKMLIANKKRMSKANNFIIDNKYIEKKNTNIIDSYYVYIRIPEKIKEKKIKLIEVNPLYGGRYFKINFTYDTDLKKYELSTELKPEECISIDLGMKNLMTIYDPSSIQTIIKGNYLISTNAYYNDKLDKLRSKIDRTSNVENKEELKNAYYKTGIKRSNKINDHMNKIVKYLSYKYKDKKLIIIGYNLNWKDSVSLGKKTNRKFYSIPYKKLLTKLQDKMLGKVRITEESYTSKCDGLGLELICKKEEYGGKRIKRGLYSSVKGLINADLNGAINIMRKVVDLKEIKGEKLCNPVVIKILTGNKIISRSLKEKETSE